MGYSPGGKRCPRNLANIKESAPPSPGAMHPNREVVRQKCQEAAWRNKEHLDKLRDKNEACRGGSKDRQPGMKLSEQPGVRLGKRKP